MSQKVSFLLMICAFSSASAYMMGQDNRMPASEMEVTMAAIQQTGQVHIQDEAFVSGIVLGANCDVVLTAGHAAVYWQEDWRQQWHAGDLRAQGKLTFSLAPEDAEGGIPMQLVATGYADTSRLTQEQNDWAIFRLARPALTSCATIPIMSDDMSCPNTFIMPAFHFDRPEIRLLDHTCGEKGRIGRSIIVHDCDTKDGSSGAPLLCNMTGGPALTGINISGLTRKEYEDPGVYGQEGNEFHPRWHKNLGVAIHDELYRVLQEELSRSRERAEHKQQKQAGEKS